MDQTNGGNKLNTQVIQMTVACRFWGKRWQIIVIIENYASEEAN